MGVRGLQTFLKNNKDVLAENIDVSNSNLVIDCKNLMCGLCAEFSLDKSSPDYRNDIYQGNLIAWANVLRDFFKSLEECKITAILVVDGAIVGPVKGEDAKDLIATKEAEKYKRGVAKFEDSKELNETSALHKDALIFPTNYNLVFRSVVRELKIQAIQCPFEADSHMARVANQYNCPVLTNDSDFIIYDLKRGFILMDTFDYKRPSVDRLGRKCIKGSLFSQARLCRTLNGLSKENMPLLSVLLGNDYVESGTFDQIMRSVCNRYYDGKLIAQTFNHRRIANLLNWLRGRSQQAAIDYILNLVHPASRRTLEQCIRMFLKNYIIDERDNFMAELERVFPRDRLAPGTDIAKSPAIYLRSLFETEQLASSLLDMIFKGVHYNHSLPEDHSKPTSNTPMFRPIAVGLALLRPKPYTDLTAEQRKIREQEDAYYIFDRVGSEYKKLVILPLARLENFGSLDHLDCYSMILLEPALKKTLIMDTFRFNLKELDRMTETLSPLFKQPALFDATICFMLVKYVGLETKLAPNKQFVIALLLTHLYYATLNGHLNKSELSLDVNGSDYDPTLPFVDHLEPHTRRNNGKDYDDDTAVYKRIIHMISELQVSYKSFELTNIQLENVFPHVGLERWFNGVLVFRLTKLKKLAEEAMDILCDNFSVLEDVCDAVRAQVSSGK